MEAVNTLGGYANSHPKTVYYRLEMTIKSEWNYSQKTCPGEEEDIEPVEDSIREEFLLELVGDNSVDPNTRELLTLRIRHIWIITPELMMMIFCAMKNCVGVTRKLWI